MATPSRDYRTTSHDELRRKYSEEGWAERLQNCEKSGRCYRESQPGRGLTLQKTFLKYWDADDNTIAVIIKYRRVDGERLSVRMLRDRDGVVYAGPSVSAAPSLRT